MKIYYSCILDFNDYVAPKRIGTYIITHKDNKNIIKNILVQP